MTELDARPVHVAARIGVLRISSHFYNSPEEIDTLLNTLEELKQPQPA